MKKIQMFLIVFCGMCLFMCDIVKSQVLSEEPKSLREQCALGKNIALTFEEPRAFFITRDNSLYLDRKKDLSPHDIQQCSLIGGGYRNGAQVYCNHYRIVSGAAENPTCTWIYVVPLNSLSKCLVNRRDRTVWYEPCSGPPFAAAVYPSPFANEPGQPFFVSHFPKAVGIHSYEYRRGGFENSASYCMVFYRGNLKIYVFNHYLDFRKAIREDGSIDIDILSQLMEAAGS